MEVSKAFRRRKKVPLSGFSHSPNYGLDEGEADCGFQNTEYRQLLIHSIHQCAIKFSEVAASVVDLLMYVNPKVILCYVIPNLSPKIYLESQDCY